MYKLTDHDTANIAGSVKSFKVIITETLELNVEVEAGNKQEAEQIVANKWRNSEYVLTGDNFTGVDFIAVLAGD